MPDLECVVAILRIFDLFDRKSRQNGTKHTRFGKVNSGKNLTLIARVFDLSFPKLIYKPPAKINPNC